MSGEKDVFWARHCDPGSCTSDPIEPESSTGKLPDWLSGVLYRTGPGVQKFGEDHYRHAFDGIAILHAVEIRNGEAKYRNRVLESDSFKKNSEANRISVTEFGTFATPDPCMTILGKFTNRFLSIPKIEVSQCLLFVFDYKELNGPKALHVIFVIWKIEMSIIALEMFCP